MKLPKFIQGIIRGAINIIFKREVKNLKDHVNSYAPINKLSCEQLEKLQQELIRRNFTDYDGLVAWLDENGVKVSRASTYRYGVKLKRTQQQIRDRTEAARLIVKSLQDDMDLRSESAIALKQSELLDEKHRLEGLD